MAWPLQFGVLLRCDPLWSWLHRTFIIAWHTHPEGCSRALCGKKQSHDKWLVIKIHVTEKKPMRTWLPHILVQVVRFPQQKGHFHFVFPLCFQTCSLPTGAESEHWKVSETTRRRICLFQCSLAGLCHPLLIYPLLIHFVNVFIVMQHTMFLEK